MLARYMLLSVRLSVGHKSKIYQMVNIAMVTQTASYVSPKLQFSEAKDLGEIPMGSSGPKGGTKYKRSR